MSNIYTGVVENRNDPFQLGRCQVRVMGLHTHDKISLSTEDLPWAYPMQPITSAAISGIGHSPVGPVEGTWVIVMFRDDDQQYPIILGTVGGIPQPRTNISDNRVSTIDLSTNSDINQVSNNSNTLVPTEVGPEVALAPDVATLPAIPTVPPKSWKGNRVGATAGIKALLAACDTVGLSTREQKCTVLAIVGGESGWIPQDEWYSYSEVLLAKTFVTTFKNNPDKLKTYARWKGSKEVFFDFVYDPKNNGGDLGNTEVGDGGKYFGRGLIQLTGRANYTKYAKLTNIDILNTPSLLSNDLTTSALVAVHYIKNQTPRGVVSTSNPGYFYAAKKKVGHDTGNGAAKRLEYYEYFYGAPVPSSATKNKSVGAPAPVVPNVDAAYPAIGGNVDGFRDPNNKYPLPESIGEPDTNRLARGLIDGTIVPVKEEQRFFGIPKALTEETYDEPSSSFSAKYPYNHVFETESGHIQEWDDTPGHERINTYHRMGTFTEIDANGTEVHHIVGDSYTIIERNGCVYIDGECNLTVRGNINILCQATANIEVTGDANIEVGVDASIAVANNLDLSVGGIMNLDVRNELNIRAKTISMQSTSSINVLASSAINIESNKYAEDENTDPSVINMKSPIINATGSNVINMLGSFNVSGGNTSLGGTITMNPPSNLNAIGGGSGDGGVSLGWTAGGSNAAAVAADAKIVIVDLYIPPDGAPTSIEAPFTIPPVKTPVIYETPEDWATPAGKIEKARLDIVNGVKNAKNTPAIDAVTTVSGGTKKTKVVSCKIITASTHFTSDFILSKNFTLGMLFDGGYNNKHKLQDQVKLKKEQIVCNLAQLCGNVLENCVDFLPGKMAGFRKRWDISSGYRQLSAVKNSSKTSDHLVGRAVDIVLYPHDTSRSKRTFDLIIELEKAIPYDQMFIEYSIDNSGTHTWIHIGYRGVKRGDTTGAGGTNRKQVGTMLNHTAYGDSGFYLL